MPIDGRAQVTTLQRHIMPAYKFYIFPHFPRFPPFPTFPLAYSVTNAYNANRTFNLQLKLYALVELHFLHNCCFFINFVNLTI